MQRLRDRKGVGSNGLFPDGLYQGFVILYRPGQTMMGGGQPEAGEKILVSGQKLPEVRDVAVMLLESVKRGQ